MFSKIPEFNKIISKAKSEFESREDILGVYLLGSIVEGKEDKHSDIDFLVFVENNSKLLVNLEERRKLATKIGNLLFDYNSRYGAYVGYYEGLIKTDFMFEEISKLKSAVRLHISMVLKDTNGLLAKTKEESSKVEYIADIETIKNKCNIFRSWVVYTYNMIKKGELYEADNTISLIRQLLLELKATYLKKPGFDFKKVHKYLEKETLDYFERITNRRLTKEDLIRVLREEMRLFVEIIKPELVEEYGIEANETLDKSIKAKIMKD